jgi:hypothetical protein
VSSFVLHRVLFCFSTSNSLAGSQVPTKTPGANGLYWDIGNGRKKDDNWEGRIEAVDRLPIGWFLTPPAWSRITAEQVAEKLSASEF